jgi:superfamily II DNA helicase RecQ
VTVEQLFKSPAGHFARLGFLIRRTKGFQHRIKRVNVDEAHCIHTAGLPLYGLPAFRPAWGMLDELKALLPTTVIWKAFSATFPPHILKTVTQKVLKPNYTMIHLTSNRPNTMYATHQVHGSLEDPRNYECFIQHPFDFKKQPHVLIFFDDKGLTKKVAQHLDEQLPPEFRGRGLVRHYHSGMSEGYLKHVHDSFVSEDGMCRILVATSGESVVSFLL